MNTHKFKALLTILFVFTISLLKAQVELNEKLTNYITKTYWNLDNLGIEARKDFNIVKTINNYGDNHRLFYTVNSVCYNKIYVGHVVSASYRDKDNLGKMRLFFPVKPTIYTDKYNFEIIANIVKNEKINPLNFKSFEMLNILSTIPENKKNSCVK